MLQKGKPDDVLMLLCKQKKRKKEKKKKFIPYGGWPPYPGLFCALP